jgi:4-amino-4-deoxy-L-arabinose transferase-like glycosyltransferase
VNSTTIESDRIARAAWLLFVAAIASSVPTFWFYLVGEEGILVNTSFEMAYRGDWLHLWLYGADARHGVFANWLIIPLAGAVGWEHAPGALRAVMVLSTAATGCTLWWLVKRLYRDTALAVFAAAVCVTFADVLLYRGWLGYRDPLLEALVFGAIATLWVAVREQRTMWLIATAALSVCAFLTKGLIAFVYVGAAVFVFLWQRETRAFLLRPASIALALATLCVPLVWFRVVLGDQTQGGRMTAEMMDKLVLDGVLAYVAKFVTYPLEALLRLAPASLLALWWCWRERKWGVAIADGHLRTALAIALTAFIPFWLAPQSHFRYLMPVIPLFALVCAVLIHALGATPIRTTMRWLWALVALKFVFALVAFPYYQQHYRGENYAAAAREIARYTAGHTLYANDVSATGLSVTAYLNLSRVRPAPLTFAPPDWDNGFVMTNEANEKLGRIAAQYRLGANILYLLCRGAACDANVANTRGR